MAFNFGFFGTPEHRVFKYKPRYYDPEKDELKQKFGRVDGTLGEKDKEGRYIPGSIVKGSFRDGNYQEQRGHGGKAARAIGLVAMLLAFAVMFLIIKYWPYVVAGLK